MVPESYDVTVPVEELYTEEVTIMVDQDKWVEEPVTVYRPKMV